MNKYFILVLTCILSITALTEMDPNELKNNQLATKLNFLTNGNMDGHHMVELAAFDKERLYTITDKLPDALPNSNLSSNHLKTKLISPEKYEEVRTILNKTFDLKFTLKLNSKPIFVEEPSKKDEIYKQMSQAVLNIINTVMLNDNSNQHDQQQWLQDIRSKSQCPDFVLPNDIEKLCKQYKILENGKIPENKMNAIEQFVGTNTYFRHIKITSKNKFIQHLNSLPPDKQKKVKISSRKSNKEPFLKTQIIIYLIHDIL